MPTRSRPGASILRRAVTRNRRRLTAGSALIGVHQACETLVPILIGVTIDRAVATGDPAQLGLWIGALAGLFLVLTSAYRQGARQLMAAIADEAHRLRLEIAAKIMHPRGLRTDLRAGDLLTISTADADQTSYLLDHVPRVAGALVAAAVSAVALFLISVPLGLVVLLVTPVVLIGLQVAAPRITRRYADQQELAGRATSLATDLVTGLRPLRGIGAQDAAAERYRTVSRLSLGATLRAARTQSGYLAASSTVSTLLACGVAILAGWFALTGRITAGQFVTVIGLAQFLGEPFGTLARVPAWIAEARASADRIALVLHAAPARPEDAAGPEPGELTLAGVSCGPLRDLHLAVRPGEFVGLVAARPADAEALMRLLSGEATAHGGTARVPARAHLLVEPHAADLFTGTIRGNVVVHEGGDLPAALAAAAADEVVDGHPDGLDREIAERGSSLSGGQRQRLALARALLAAPPALVLHDPTTAVDAVTEQAIAQGIRALRHGPGSAYATLVITSSPALLAHTDRVLLLRDGTVAAEGDHATLGATDPGYRAAVLR